MQIKCIGNKHFLCSQQEYCCMVFLYYSQDFADLETAAYQDFFAH